MIKVSTAIINDVGDYILKNNIYHLLQRFI